MINISKKYQAIKPQLLSLSKVTFGLRDLTRAGFRFEEALELLQLISNDPEFYLVTLATDPKLSRFTSLKRIISIFAEVNLRPSGTFTEPIPQKKIYDFIGLKFGFSDQKIINTKKIISDLSNYGLITSANENYSFPIHHLLGYIHRLDYTEETELMINFICENVKANIDLYNYFFIEANNTIRHILATLTEREEKVIMLRYGIGCEEKLTLEQTGHHFDLTRERVRQIEEKAFRRLRHPSRLNALKSLPYKFIISNKGGLLVDFNAADTNALIFIFTILNIPFYKIEGDFLLGSINLPNDCYDPNLLWGKEIDHQSIRYNLDKIGFWWLGNTDMQWITNCVEKIVNKKQTKIHRVYIALKSLGRPSHFSEITMRHNELFPKYSCNEHNVHAPLTMYADHFIWTGKMGTYALPEWGYDRPKMSLMETCYRIVDKQYQQTSRPVEYSYVQSQIHKYRKVINPNSVLFACYFNEAIEVITDKRLIPREIIDFDYIDTDEDYKKIEEHLEEFEKELKQQNL